MNILPEYLRQLLLDSPETGVDLHVVAITLANGRVIEDVAIVNCSVIACVRGKPFVWFDGSDVASLHVSHRRWGAGHLSTR
ncbi:MAG: hypothetical protein H0V63_05430 [Burkholderiaceae bacterium]|nr:hypothetical protein [Burkholderiaceae bacterium]